MAAQDDRADSSLGDGLGILHCIPEEVRLKVFESLVPDHLPIGTRSELSPDILGSRKALLSLCLTSKKCYGLALPFLYKYVIITDYVQVASLLVTLMFEKKRRAWIHRLAVLVEFPLEYHEETISHNCDFMTNTIDRLKEIDNQSLERDESRTLTGLRMILPELQDLIPAVPEPLPYPDYIWYEDTRRRRYDEDLNYAHYDLLQTLFTLQINIKDILIVIMPAFDDGFCSPRCGSDIMDQFRLDRTQPHSENPLKNLLCIRKQSHRIEHLSFHPAPLAPEYLGSKDWEFHRDNGTWFFDDYMDGQGWSDLDSPLSDLTIFSHVTDLGLYKSWTHPAQLRVILSSCNSLKAFCYTTNATKWSITVEPLPSTDEQEGIPVPTLQQALDEVRGTLKELRLGWSRPGHVLTAHEEEAVAPHRVDISGFPHLTPGKVDIDCCFDARPLSGQE